MRGILSVTTVIILVVFSYNATAQENSDPGRDYFVTAFVNNDAPYVGQSVRYTFQFYARVVPGNITEELPPFINFWLGSIQRAEDRRVTVDGNQFILTEYTAELTGLRAGVTVIDAARIVVPETPFRAGAELTSDALTLTIRELPPNAPDGFSGAVGQLDIAFELDSTQTSTGEPIRLSARISGAGDLARLPAPEIDPVDDWRIYRNPPTYDYNNLSGLAFGEKRFEWLLVPHETGSHTLPPIIYTYFDPQAEEYRRFESPAYTIEVFPGESSDPQRGLLTVEQAPAYLQSIRALAHNPAGLRSSPPLWAWVGPGALIILAVAWTTQARLVDRRRKRTRRLHAKERALQRLSRLRQLETKPGQEATLQIVRGYIADCMGRSVPNSVPTLIKILKSQNANIAAIEGLNSKLSTISGRRFAPDHAKEAMTIEIEKIAQLITDLDHSWR